MCSSRPDHSPGTFKEARSWAKYLDTCSADERAQEIDGFCKEESLVSPSKQSGKTAGSTSQLWKTCLRKCFHPDELSGIHHPSLTELQNDLEKDGYSCQEADHILQQLLGGDVAQKAWTDWEQVTDRKELEKRLRFLGQVDQIRDDLIPFLWFYFRSSNPFLSRASAVTIGRHLAQNEKLQENVRNFLQEREVSISNGIVLNGDRSRRRILYLVVSCLASGQLPPFLEPETIPDFPVQLSEEKEEKSDTKHLELPSNPSDLIAVLFSLEVLLSSAHTNERIYSFVEPYLKKVPEFEGTFTRSIVREWGRLFVTYCEQGTDLEGSSLERTDLWEGMRTVLRVSSRDQQTFSRRLSRLFLLDEAIRTLVFAPEEVREQILNRITNWNEKRQETLFYIQRYLTWSWRLQRQPPSDYGDMTARIQEELPETEFTEFSLAFRSLFDLVEDGSDELFHGREQGSLKDLRLFLKPLSNESTWGRLQMDERVLRSFYLLDLTRHVEYPGDELRHLYRSVGLPVKLLNEFNIGREGTGPSMQILLRLLKWEGPEFGTFLDAKTLHMVEEEQVLLALIPTRREGRELRYLADAFEHQLRQRRSMDPDFDPGKFLYRTLIRNPDPTFYTCLEEVTQERTYRTSSGETLPIQEWVQDFYTITREMKDVEREAGSITGNEYRPDPARVQKLQNSMSPFLRLVGNVRKKLLEFTDVKDKKKDPRPSLQKLVRFLGPTGVGASPGPGTLIHFQKDLHEGEEELLQSGSIVSFVAQFSPIWLSLMIGVFSLLDFGDPWTEMAKMGDWAGVWINFSVAAGATYLYLLLDLVRKVKRLPGTSSVVFWGKRVLRVGGFLVICATYTMVVVTVFWWLLSNTGQVVTGVHAPAHIIVWSAFGLFVGVFVGLIAMGLVQEEG